MHRYRNLFVGLVVVVRRFRLYVPVSSYMEIALAVVTEKDALE